MTHLNIQQGLNVEVVSTLIIKKLYDAAQSVPLPEEGEQDLANMSGNLLVDKTYRAQVSYLTTRFPNLHINVTDSYYIPFEDSNVLSVLLTNNIGTDSTGITEAEAANATLTSAMFKNNTDITSFGGFKYFTKANTNPPNLLFMGCSNLSSVDLSNVTTLSLEEFSKTGLTNVVLPENVTTIPAGCFSWTRSLVSVTAPGVLVITQRAFDLCSGLTSFSDFSNVTTIGENAFLGAPLTGVFNAPNLTSLARSALQDHKFEGIECIGTVSSIPDNCFGHNTWCDILLYVYLPYECTQLGNYSFARAGALTTVKQYDKTISDYQEGETKTFFPNLGKITIFGNGCFKECNTLTLTSDDITNATEIGANAFENVKVTGNISLPHLTSLGAVAFKNCKTLTSIECLGKISSIPSDCFLQDTALQTVKLPYECTSITDHAFHNCSSLTSITQYNKSLDDYAEGESPTFTNISRITSFGTSCFEGCSLLSLTPQEIQNATTIGSLAFKNTLLSGDIVLPQLSAIGTYAFERTRITSIDLTGSSISSLPSGVFRNCSSLSKISIPTSVTYLDWYWGDGIANVVTLEGFDNCASHGLYNWQLYNKTILNPIKTSFNNSPIMFLWSNTTDINYNLLYNPSTTTTLVGRCGSSHEYYTYFVGRPTGGSSRVNIGLLYFRDISSFGALTFFKCNIDNLVINNATPPTLNYSTNSGDRYYNTQVWDNNIFPTGNSDQNDNVVIGTLWVPDSAVATYQADPLYSHLNIKGINTKTNGTDYDLPRYATYAAWKAAEEAAVAQGGHAVTGIIEEYM